MFPKLKSVEIDSAPAGYKSIMTSYSKLEKETELKSQRVPMHENTKNIPPQPLRSASAVGLFPLSVEAPKCSAAKRTTKIESKAAATSTQVLKASNRLLVDGLHDVLSFVPSRI